MVKRSVTAFVVLVSLFITDMALSMPEELKSFLKDRRQVRICIDLKNSSADKRVDTALLKKILEEGFLARRSYDFQIADTPDKADLILDGDVKEYLWQTVDPVDEVWGAVSTAMDAAIADNYARMQVQMELIEAKNSRVIWSDKVQSTVTHHVMPQDASYDIVYKRFLKSLMTELFKKSS